MRRLIKPVLWILVAAMLAAAAGAEETAAPGCGRVLGWQDTWEGFRMTGDQTDLLACVPDTILSRDDRVRVKDVTAFPYSSIAFMDVVCECGCGWECSGAVAGKPNIVLTSAHSLVCPDHGAPAETLILYFGYENYHRKLYRYDGSWKAWTGNLYRDREYTFHGDWGLILLEEDVGEQVGCLELNWNGREKAGAEQTARIAGYSDGELYTDQGLLTVMDDELFQYFMDQDSGASGGPILDEDNRIIGIVIGHQTDDDGVQSNIGYMLTEEIREAYESILQQAQDRPSGI